MRAGKSRVRLGGHVPQPMCGARVPVALRWRGRVRWLICCQRGPRRPLGLLLCGETQQILAQGRLLVKEEKGEFWPAVAGPHTYVTWLCACGHIYFTCLGAHVCVHLWVGLGTPVLVPAVQKSGYIHEYGCVSSWSGQEGTLPGKAEKVNSGRSSPSWTPHGVRP